MRWQRRQKILIALVAVAVAALMARLVLGSDSRERYPTEAEWRDGNAQRYGARAEVRLWDDTRCDLVSETHAIEIDWAYKGWSSFAKSIWYAGQLRLKPGIILLVRTGEIERDRRMVYRLLYVAAKYDIDIWVEEVGPKIEGELVR